MTNSRRLAPATLGRRMLTSTRRLQHLGLGTVTIHIILLALTQWAIFEQFRARTAEHLQHALVIAFQANAVRTAAAEALGIGLGGLTTVMILRRRSFDGASRAFAVFLLSYGVIVIYSIAVLLFFAAGWRIDVWVMSTTSASQQEVANTVREALPIVLRPLWAARLIANAGAACVLASLGVFWCGVSVRRAGSAAIATALITVLAYEVV